LSRKGRALARDLVRAPAAAWSLCGRALAIAACLVLPPAGAAADAAAPATVFVNARIFTAEPDAPYAEAIAIRGDRIVATGTRQGVLARAGANARVVDLAGGFLMPGLIDAHAHPVGSRLSINGGLDLLMAHYPTETIVPEKLIAFVNETAAAGRSRFGDVVVVRSVDSGYWSAAAQLDAALSHGKLAAVPVMLVGADGHTAWCNRAARERAGISAAMLRALPVPERAYYGVGAGLEPNGFVVDHGLTRLLTSLSRPGRELLLDAGRAAVRHLNSLGITAWLDAAAVGVVGGDLPLSRDDPGGLPVYRELSRRGELTAHVAAYPVIDPRRGVEQLEVVQAFRREYGDVPNLAVAGIKVFADGVVEIPSQTAALTQPYRNTGRRAPLQFDPADFRALVAEADRRGLAVHIHAIGDLAVKASLDAIGAARAANPSGRLPHTITHAQFVDDEDLARFAQVGAIAALQLLWATADASTNEEVRPYVAPEIWRTMYPARSLLQAGAVIAGASDWPVSDANPFAAISQAQTRAGSEGVLDARERMPREAMLYAYTRNAAQVLGQLEDIGTLAPGKRADMILLDRDALTASPEELRGTKVVWTLFGGRAVYGAAP
jgi:predicted amidohydrolase YtcJ